MTRVRVWLETPLGEQRWPVEVEVAASAAGAGDADAPACTWGRTLRSLRAAAAQATGLPQNLVLIHKGEVRPPPRGGTAPRARHRHRHGAPQTLVGGGAERLQSAWNPLAEGDVVVVMLPPPKPPSYVYREVDGDDSATRTDSRRGWDPELMEILGDMESKMHPLQRKLVRLCGGVMLPLAPLPHAAVTAAHVASRRGN
eukprot:scaffold2295_cov354-Prasinococcus_capsulatus_cf.AAC.11